ncbi:MAG: formate dehydrogenase accessory protein FdhE, partial [Planctomycetota bacterium]
MSDVWDRRIRRASELQREWPFAADLLGFYRALAAVQRDLSRLDRSEALVRLVAWIAERAPVALAAQARAWKPDPVRCWLEEESRSHAPGGCARNCPSPLYHFLRDALGQAFAVGRRVADPARAELRGESPCCAAPPVASILREDREAGALRRTLLCGRCAHEWNFPRLLCPQCREERPEKLPRYGAAEIPWVRIEACDSCRRYLKAIDLSKNPAAEPLVD